jgi:hypothetical protein
VKLIFLFHQNQFKLCSKGKHGRKEGSGGGKKSWGGV